MARRPTAAHFEVQTTGWAGLHVHLGREPVNVGFGGSRIGYGVWTEDGIRAESCTIQKVIRLFYPSIFTGRDAVKHFLTVLGDIMIRLGRGTRVLCV